MKNINPRPFRLDPTNVKETFISLVTETYPMGYEDELLTFLPTGLTRDRFGNYFKIIGTNPKVSFTSHLDSHTHTKTKLNLMEYSEGGSTFITTDGENPLGADDKAGVAVMIYMMSMSVPGIYWFFMGEERGSVGSINVVENLNDYEFMRDIKTMVSFDRREYGSIITHQSRVRCCSDEFAQKLCSEFQKGGMDMRLDPTGVHTDSANFVGVIDQCTNISVGYFNEHQGNEKQDITYLERLSKASTLVNWQNL